MSSKVICLGQFRSHDFPTGDWRQKAVLSAFYKRQKNAYLEDPSVNTEKKVLKMYLCEITCQIACICQDRCQDGAHSKKQLCFCPQPLVSSNLPQDKFQRTLTPAKRSKGNQWSCQKSASFPPRSKYTVYCFLIFLKQLKGTMESYRFKMIVQLCISQKKRLWFCPVCLGEAVDTELCCFWNWLDALDALR